VKNNTRNYLALLLLLGAATPAKLISMEPTKHPARNWLGPWRDEGQNYGLDAYDGTMVWAMDDLDLVKKPTDFTQENCTQVRKPRNTRTRRIPRKTNPRKTTLEEIVSLLNKKKIYTLYRRLKNRGETTSKLPEPIRERMLEELKIYFESSQDRLEKELIVFELNFLINQALSQ